VVGELGTIEQLEPRTVWPDEARDFTPWLLENSKVLSELLGMDLELQNAEHAVGDFSLDLIGKDAATGSTVIVENQLEASDHTHLGQLLTYAAGTDPTVVVWVTRKFREEHRAALDWLNERTDETTQFFGVEIGVVRIGDSLPAPNFKLVAKPNNWGKTVKAATAARELSDRDRLRQEFWELALGEIKRRHPDWTSSNPGPGTWFSTRSGSKNYSYQLTWYRTGLASDIQFDGGASEDNLRRFLAIKEQRIDFEHALGKHVKWDEVEGRKSQKITLESPFTDLNDRERWPQMVDWLISTQEGLRRAIEEIGGVPN